MVGWSAQHGHRIPFSATCIWLNVALDLGFQQKLLGGRLPWPLSPVAAHLAAQVRPRRSEVAASPHSPPWMVTFFGFRMMRQSCMVAFYFKTRTAHLQGLTPSKIYQRGRPLGCVAAWVPME